MAESQKVPWWRKVLNVALEVVGQLIAGKNVR